RNPFVHSAVMMRRALVERAGGYDETLPVAQDYDLWLRLSRLARLANLPEPRAVRRLLPGRATAGRDAQRLGAGGRVRSAAGAAGEVLSLVTSQSQAQSYLRKARGRLKALAVLRDEGDHSDVVREAQELVELALKGMLRAVGVEPPKFHDVGRLLVEHRGKF